MKVSREFKVGLTAIIAILLLYWGVNFLKGQNLFSDERVYYAVYSRVDGLTNARPVMINGYQVGQVDQVYFHPDGSGRLMVKMQMNNEFPVADNSVASIQSTDLLGEKSIELVLGKGPGVAKSGDTLRSNIKLTLTEEVNQQVAPLKTKAEKLFASMDTVLTLVSGFLNTETRDNFMETFNSVRRSFKKLENTVGTIDNTVSETQGDVVSSVHNITEVTKTLSDNTAELNNIFANLNTISDSLAEVRFAETFKSLQQAMEAAEGISKKINEGEGSLGKLVNDDELYNNLQDASKQLDLLLMDFRYNPKRYVNFSLFGKNQPYDPESLPEETGEQESEEEQ